MPEAPSVSRYASLPTRGDVFVNRPVHEGDVALHHHDFIEIAMVISGRGHHRSIGGLRMVRRGDTFMIHPGQWHAYEGCQALHIFNCCFRPRLMDSELSWLAADPLLGPLVARTAADQEIGTFSVDEAGALTSLGLIDRIRVLQDSDPLAVRVDLIALLLMLLGELARQRMRTPGPHRTDASKHHSVGALMRLIDSDLSHDWSLEEIAHRLKVDRSHLIRLFRRHTGVTPMLYLARRRGEQAAVRLLTTNTAIAAIGRDVGWKDPNYFARRFRSLFGMSPRDYRSQLPCPATSTAPEELRQW